MHHAHHHVLANDHNMMQEQPLQTYLNTNPTPDSPVQIHFVLQVFIDQLRLKQGIGDFFLQQGANPELSDQAGA